MRKNILFFFSVPIFLSLCCAQVFSSEDAALMEQEWGIPIQEWVLGDVTYLDTVNNQLTLSYIDYSGKERLINLIINSNTEFDFAQSLKDIKVGDVVSVDYKITTNGEAVALSVSVERIKGIEQLPSESLL